MYAKVSVLANFNIYIVSYHNCTYAQLMLGSDAIDIWQLCYQSNSFFIKDLEHSCSSYIIKYVNIISFILYFSEFKYTVLNNVSIL